MTRAAGAPGTAGGGYRGEVAQCRRVLHIDWDADPVPIREDVARCSREQGHDGQHRNSDGSWSW